MTDYREEQEGEVEALRSIYPEDELKILSEDPYCLEVKIAVEDGDNSQVSVDVRFTLPANYPDEVPEIIIMTGVGVEGGEMRELERVLTQQAEENVGSVMVFTLVCGVQEHLQQRMERAREEVEREKREREEEQQRLEEAKYRGTLVTVESFRVWKEGFEKEMREKGGKQREDTASTGPSRPTGRQMFERDMTLALSDAKFFADNEDDVGGEPRRQEEEVEVDESLFEDLEDLALDNDS